VIGPATADEHKKVLKELLHHPLLEIVEQIPDLPESPATLQAHLIVVLQSYSDQFGRKSVNRFIEQTLGTRIYCCYGPWCASDGRAFDTWPPGMRIPAREFPDFLAVELNRMKRNEPPLPPTAAGEELFARWHGPPPRS